MQASGVTPGNGCRQSSPASPCPGARIRAVLPMTVMLAFRYGTMVDKGSERPSGKSAVGGTGRRGAAERRRLVFMADLPNQLRDLFILRRSSRASACTAVPALRVTSPRSSSWNLAETRALSPQDHHDGEGPMAVNKPTGDNARKGAVKKRSQMKTTLAGASAWTKRTKPRASSWHSSAPVKRRKRRKNSKA